MAANTAFTAAASASTATAWPTVEASLRDGYTVTARTAAATARADCSHAALAAGHRYPVSTAKISPDISVRRAPRRGASARLTRPSRRTIFCILEGVGWVVACATGVTSSAAGSARGGAAGRAGLALAGIAVRTFAVDKAPRSRDFVVIRALSSIPGAAAATRAREHRFGDGTRRTQAGRHSRR